jgi:hypothetical protein
VTTKKRAFSKIDTTKTSFPLKTIENFSTSWRRFSLLLCFRARLCNHQVSQPVSKTMGHNHENQIHSTPIVVTNRVLFSFSFSNTQTAFFLLIFLGGFVFGVVNAALSQWAEANQIQVSSKLNIDHSAFKLVAAEDIQVTRHAHT